MTTKPTIKLTYFDIEGVAECIRLALVLSGTDFEDDRVKYPQWQDLKPKTPYGKLPVMTIDGEEKTQSMAMLRYVGATFSKSLYPSDKLFDIEEAIGLVKDMTDSWSAPLYMGMRPSTYGYPDDYAKTDEGKAKVETLRKKWTKEELPKFLKFLSDRIDKNGGKWLCSGADPSIADCLLIPSLRNFTRGHVDHVPTDVLDCNPKIVDYVKRFCALPEIKGRYTNGLH